MVEEDVRQRRRKRRDAGEEPGALDGVGADLCQLQRVELPGLRQDLGAHVHLADVVKRRAEAKRVEPGVRPAETNRDRLGVRGDARGMSAERRITNLHCGREGSETDHGLSGSLPVAGTLPVDSSSDADLRPEGVQTR